MAHVGGQAWEVTLRSEGLRFWLLCWVGSLTGQARPHLGLSGGEGLPKLLAPPAINVLHFPEFLQRAARMSCGPGRTPEMPPILVLAWAPPI